MELWVHYLIQAAVMADSSRNLTSNAPIFFHSITGEPLLPQSRDPDSETESRASWHQESELADIDEYDDLQPADKFLFKSISQRMRRDISASDRHIKEVLLDFLQTHRDVGKAFRVYLALLLHKNILSGDDVYHVLLELRKHAS
jgi:hypothetical protein